ncbi:MAG: DUF1543 domain-containing protein [Candidatus Nomurabacteria bacterium]|nr:DUF1543 domain-containing protein [Candidatus Nomurabacteria bacterium]USN88033.1 MAG: DUF1543 domain-containing protein [Candidatus Nomurabacteria bacterium]
MGSKNLKLFVVLLGARESGYLFEQHKYFFCVASGLEEIKTKAKEFWPRANVLHIDAYICLERVAGYGVVVEDRYPGKVFDEQIESTQSMCERLFFINLGGYREGYFGEVHKQIFVVAADKAEAKTLAKQDSFFEDKTLIQAKESYPDVDDMVCVNDLNLGGYDLVLEEIDNPFPIKESEVVVTGGFLRI